MRNFVELVLTNRLFTILFVIVLAAQAHLLSLRISSLPRIEMATLIINMVLPRASARELGQRVSSPIDVKPEKTRELNRFESNITNSSALIPIEYACGVDTEDGSVGINSTLNNIWRACRI